MFKEEKLPPITDKEFWAQYLWDNFYGHPTDNEAVKMVRCRRIVKEITTGTRTVFKQDSGD